VLYLDHAATTTLRPAARRAVDAAFDLPTGNPTGAHRNARGQRALLEDARERLAALLGVRVGDVVFTSGGTEADVWAVRGAPAGARIRSAVEHPAVAEPVDACGGGVVAVDHSGVVDLDALEDLVRSRAAADGVGLVSVMSANNETGVVQPVAEVIDVVARCAPGALVHTDAVQAFTKFPLGPLFAHAAAVGVAFAASLSAHKVGGPVGVGALVVGPGTSLTPLLCGGGQERGRRAGTPPVALAAGFAAAADDATADDWGAVAARRDRLEAALCAGIDGLVVHGADARRLPTHCNVAVPGVDADMLVVACDRAGVQISSGSSCASGALKPSATLAAMGAADDGAALRCSLGWDTTDDDVRHAATTICDVVARLRTTGRVA
jgi:cysteine desulfurase